MNFQFPILIFFAATGEISCPLPAGKPKASVHKQPKVDPHKEVIEVDVKVFVDESMQALLEINNVKDYGVFFRALMNSVEYLFNGNSLEISKRNIFRFEIVEIIKITKNDVNIPANKAEDLVHGNNRYDEYLDNFHNFQEKLRSNSEKKRDYSILFTALARLGLYEALNMKDLKEEEMLDKLQSTHKYASGSAVQYLVEEPEPIVNFGTILIHSAFLLISQGTTHEIGHVMGLDHDSTDNKKSIMNDFVSSGSSPFSWSEESNQHFNKILTKLKQCLLKPLVNIHTPIVPVEQMKNQKVHSRLAPSALKEPSIIEPDRPLFGQVFNADRQCQFMYGLNWRASTRQIDIERMCFELQCERLVNGKIIQIPKNELFGAEPGTRCGPIHECHNGKCVEQTMPEFLRNLNARKSEFADSNLYRE